MKPWFDDQTILEGARAAWTQPDPGRWQWLLEKIERVNILCPLLWLWVFFSHIYRGTP